MAKLIKADGTETIIQPKNGSKFSLEELQALVGGYIALLRPGNHEYMYLNEDGKLRGLPVNTAATQYVRQHNRLFSDSDYIVGDVVICSRREFK